MCLKGYKAHVSGISSPAPLTDREEALKELQQSGQDPNYGTDSRYVELGPVSTKAVSVLWKPGLTPGTGRVFDYPLQNPRGFLPLVGLKFVLLFI